MSWGILLGGGRSSRMGTDKLELARDGRSVAAWAVAALTAVADRVVFVSPERPGLAGGRVLFALEDPPFGGPVAGLAVGLALVPEDIPDVYVLAGDLARPDAVVRRLAHAPLGPDGVALSDGEGWIQYLAARYRTAALRRKLAELEGERDVSVRRALHGLRLATVPVPAAVVSDLDTPEQAADLGFTTPEAHK